MAAVASRTEAEDRRWMRRALRQAALSAGQTSPNPGVGCVLVRHGRLLADGRHRACGGPHAEVAALRAAAEAGVDIAGATAYVSLAPCTRQGRTPPCVDALITAGLARVVAAVADPGQDRAGERLAAAGIDYAVGCEGMLAEQIHGGFLQRVTTGRPRITGKWAMTLDGQLAATTGHSAWISSAEARALSRRRRRAFDAILVGAGTLRQDDPILLAATTAPERSPLRIVLAGSQALAPPARLFSAAVPVLLVHDQRLPAADREAWLAAGARLHGIADTRDTLAVAQVLGAIGLNDVLVEGGATVHAAFLQAGCYDRLECYLGAKTLAGGLPVARGPGRPAVPAADGWELEDRPRLLGSTVLLRYRAMRFQV